MRDCQHRMVEIRVIFDDIYYWGEGWKDNTTAQKWNEYLSKLNSNHWTYFHNTRLSDSYHLIGISSNVFLHPMDFHAYVPIIGTCYRIGDNGEKNENFDTIRELIDIAKGLAEYCGGEAKVDFIRLQEFDDNGKCYTTELDENNI